MNSHLDMCSSLGGDATDTATGARRIDLVKEMNDKSSVGACGGCSVSSLKDENDDNDDVSDHGNDKRKFRAKTNNDLNHDGQQNGNVLDSKSDIIQKQLSSGVIQQRIDSDLSLIHI